MGCQHLGLSCRVVANAVQVTRLDKNLGYQIHHGSQLGWLINRELNQSCNSVTNGITVLDWKLENNNE